MTRKGSGTSRFKNFMASRAEKLPAGNSGDEPVPAPRLPPASMVKSGAVGAMARTLDQINGAVAARDAGVPGRSVLEVPAEQIDPSFARDRFDVEGPGYQELLRSIREGGQQVPVLLRPNPGQPGRYQIAYGHRRVRALGELRRPVRAVVREMTDDEVVLAQGQENSARTDLTYIERVRFAATLLERGFSSTLVMQALGMEKTQYSRLLSLRTIPQWLTEAIGPAPKIGRPRWTDLSDRLERLDAEASLRDLVSSDDFRALESDGRFARVLAAVTEPATLRARKPSVLKDTTGRKVATIERGPTRLAVVIQSRKGLPFGEWLAERLPDLHRQFEEREKGGAGDA